MISRILPQFFILMKKFVRFGILLETLDLLSEKNHRSTHQLERGHMVKIFCGGGGGIYRIANREWEP
jgi:hypothetical protein